MIKVFRIIYIIIEYLNSFLCKELNPYIITFLKLTTESGYDASGRFYYVKNMKLVDGYAEFNTNIGGKIYRNKIVLYYPYKKFSYLSSLGSPGKDFLDIIRRKYFGENNKGLELVLSRTNIVIPFDIKRLQVNERYGDEIFEYVLEFDKASIIPEVIFSVCFEIGGNIIIRLKQ